MICKLPVTMIIPTMERPESLMDTLNSIFKYNFIPNEIIVVDQTQNLNSKLENYKICNNGKYQKIIKYYYLEKPSLTVARNYGVKNSSNEIIIFSDDDVNVEETTIQNIYNIMKNDNVALIAGMNSNEKKTHDFLSYLAGTKSFFKRNKGHMTRSILGRFPNKITEKTNTEWAMGFFFVIRKTLMNKWNLQFNENCRGYAFNEDLDFTYRYCFKSRQEKMECFFSTLVCAEHKVSGDNRVSTESGFLRYLANRYYMIYKLGLNWTYKFWYYYSNFCLSIKFLFTKNNYKCFKNCMKKVKKYKREIAIGDFHNVY